MAERKFMIDGREVSIGEELIKDYYAYPECYIKDQHELRAFNGNIYVSQDGEHCNGTDCTLDMPSEILGADGNKICHSQEEFELQSTKGFIYGKKLYFLENLKEV